jgi:hypothetical protein
VSGAVAFYVQVEKGEGESPQIEEKEEEKSS